MKRKFLLRFGCFFAAELAASAAAVMILRRLGQILGGLLSADGDMDFAAIFAQTADAAIRPCWLLPLIVCAVFAALLFFDPLKRCAKGWRIAFWSVVTVLFLLGTLLGVLLLTRVNDIRFCDLLAALLPVLGAL